MWELFNLTFNRQRRESIAGNTEKGEIKYEVIQN